MSSDIKNKSVTSYAPDPRALDIQYKSQLGANQRAKLEKPTETRSTDNTSEQNTYQADRSTSAQVGHQTLAKPPPVPEDGPVQTSKSRAVANRAATRMGNIGYAMALGGTGAGIAQAAASHPDRAYAAATSSSSSTTYSSPSGGVSSSSSSVDPAVTEKLDSAASQLSDDCKSKGACNKGESGPQRGQFESDLMHKDGLTREQAHWVYEQIRSGSEQGQALAKSVVAANYGTDDSGAGRHAHQGFENFLTLRNNHFFNEPSGTNPNGDAMRQQFGQAIGTMMANDEARRSGGAASSGAAQDWSHSVATLTSLSQAFGMQMSSSAFGVGTGGEPPVLPSQTSTGWQVKDSTP